MKRWTQGGVQNGIRTEIFSGPPIVDGLVWRDEWRAPYEGALTLLWKIALANCLTPRELCQRLFGTHLLLGDPYEMHGRTLLTPGWMLGAKGNSTELGQIVRQCGLDVASAGWASAIASDKHIRYCKTCVTEGYQSAYCQIDGLRICPVHGLPLLDVCTACGAPTPRYALISITMLNPFCCPACGEPYGERVWSPAANSGIHDGNRVAYRVLDRWMSSVEKLQLFWPHLASWHCSREGQQGDTERRIAVFAILTQLATLRLKRAHRRMPVADISMSVHRAAVAKTANALRCVDAIKQWNRKLDAYVAIRRHIRRILARHHRCCLRDGLNALRIEWDSELLHPIAPICPLVFAYFLWRHHFEANMSLHPRTESSNRELTMRDESMAWPVDWDVGATAWSTFALLSFFAFVQVAKEWDERIKGCTAPLYEETSAALLMQPIMDFRVAFSPRYLTWTSRVTIFGKTRFQPGDEEDVVIVGPAGCLREMLSQHFCTGNSQAVPQLKSVPIQPRLVFPRAGNAKLLRDAPKIPKPEVHIAPLDRIKLPPELDGHICSSRLLSLNNIKAETDVEAVKIWLHRYEENPSTLYSYQLAVEKLLNWAVVERHKPLSSLDDSDLIAFEEFLADPQPRGRWVSARGTARSDPNWTPIFGPLSPRSQLLTLVIIRGMFDWLTNMGYCDAGRSLFRHSIRSRYRPSSLRLSVTDDTTPKTIQLEDWHRVRQALEDEANTPQQLLSRLAIELIYYGNLSATEVGNIQVDHIIRTEYATLLYIPSRSPGLSTIYLLPPVITTLDRLGITGSTVARRSVNDEIAMDNQSPHLFTSARAPISLIKNVLRRAAHVAESKGDTEFASRLTALTARSLHHSFESHARQFCDGNWVWLLIGAARLVAATTRQYLPRRKDLTEVELQHAFCSLAPCWNGEDVRSE